MPKRPKLLARTTKLAGDLEEATERSDGLDATDPNRLYKLLDDEKAGRRADIERLNGVIEGEKAARASDIKRLDGLIEDEKAAHERDSKRLNGLIEDEKAINATKQRSLAIWRGRWPDEWQIPNASGDRWRISWRRFRRSR